MEKAKILRINELAKLAKERDLTEAELKERELLRNEYRDGFRRNLISSLDNTYIVDEKGNKVKVTKVEGN